MKGVPLFTRIFEESITLKNDSRENTGVSGEINLQVQNTSTTEYRKLNKKMKNHNKLNVKHEAVKGNLPT